MFIIDLLKEKITSRKNTFHSRISSRSKRNRN